jgi:hypothetical protein
MKSNRKLALTAVVVVAAALLGYRYVVAPNVVLEPTASADVSRAVAATLPRLSLPSTRGNNPPGVYGWEGAEGNTGGMHRVADGAEVAAMFFGVGPNCLERRADQHPVALRVAGLEGISVEPYVPALMFNNVGDEITRAYALDVDGRTLCVFVTWHPTTSDPHRATTFEILDSLRAELHVTPSGQERIRITFTLRDRWDTG